MGGGGSETGAKVLVVSLIPALAIAISTSPAAWKAATRSVQQVISVRMKVQLDGREVAGEGGLRSRMKTRQFLEERRREVARPIPELPPEGYG